MSFLFVSYDLFIGSTETKYIKLNTKTQFFLITLDFCIHFKKENFFFSFCFLVPPVKVYKKVVKFSFTQQKIFWVFSIRIWFIQRIDHNSHCRANIFLKFQLNFYSHLVSHTFLKTFKFKSFPKRNS